MMMMTIIMLPAVAFFYVNVKRRQLEDKEDKNKKRKSKISTIQQQQNNFVYRFPITSQLQT